MHRLWTVLWGTLMLLAAVPAVLGETAADSPLAIIVHPARQTQLGVQDLVHVYLKKRRFWDDGEPIIALNREPGSAARESFSRRVLGADSSSFGSYWNDQYFQGTFPPPTLSSEAAVKRYVATERNAIGYIHPNEVDGSVRVILRLD